MGPPPDRKPLRFVWLALTVVSAFYSLGLTAASLWYLNEVRTGDGCPWTLDIDVQMERLDMEWFPGRVVCRSYNLETGEERIHNNDFTDAYFWPLSLLVPIVSFVVLHRTRPKT